MITSNVVVTIIRCNAVLYRYNNGQNRSHPSDWRVPYRGFRDINSDRLGCSAQNSNMRALCIKFAAFKYL